MEVTVYVSNFQYSHVHAHMPDYNLLAVKGCSALVNKMSAPTEYTNAIYSEVAGEKFDGQSGASPIPVSTAGQGDSGKVSKNSRAIIVLFVLMLALLLTMVAACVAFAVEVSKLKSETASLSAVSSFQQPLIENLTQQLRQELLRSNQQLNSSIRMTNQQLVQEYAARGQYEFSLWTPVPLSLPPPHPDTTGPGPPLAPLCACIVA